MPNSPPPLLKELPSDAFASWRHHPITAMFLAYLVDVQRSLSLDHLDRWQRNQLLPAGGEDEARGRVVALEEITTLELHHIKQFYGVAETAAGDEDQQ